MVMLVLHAAGEQAGAFEDVRRAVGVAVAHDGPLDALDVAGDAGEGEAPFGVSVRLAGRHAHRRVGEEHRHDLFWLAGFAVEQRKEVLVVHIHDEELQGKSDLRGREADALGGLHRA